MPLADTYIVSVRVHGARNVCFLFLLMSSPTSVRGRASLQVGLLFGIRLREQGLSQMGLEIGAAKDA